MIFMKFLIFSFSVPAKQTQIDFEMKLFLFLKNFQIQLHVYIAETYSSWSRLFMGSILRIDHIDRTSAFRDIKGGDFDKEQLI